MNPAALSITGAAVLAALLQTRLANSVLRLFQNSLAVPTPQTPLADFTTAIATFDGYADITVTTWHAPILNGQGWMTYAPSETFAWNHVSADVGNMIQGWYLVDSTGALIGYGVFDAAIPMTGPGQAIVVQPSITSLAG